MRKLTDTDIEALAEAYSKSTRFMNYFAGALFFVASVREADCWQSSEGYRFDFENASIICRSLEPFGCPVEPAVIRDEREFKLTHFA